MTRRDTNAEIPGCPPEEVRGRRRTMWFLGVAGVTMFIFLVIAILLGIRARERAESKLLQEHERGCHSRGKDHPPQAESANR